MTRSLLTVLLLAGTTVPAVAQAPSPVDRRVDRLEREMRAVQRQVFPGGAGGQDQVLQPEIVPQSTAPDAPGVPASSPLSALSQRVGSLEAQLSELTGQTEQAQYRIRQLEQRLEQLAEELARRPVAPAEPVEPPPSETSAPRPASGAARPATPPRGQTPAADPARAGRVAAIERPSTGNAVEDGYSYGFRLWQARLYPEAQAALKTVADANPNHRRYSWAQNLLGRAYLDDGKPALAAIAFYDNYQKNPDGERAADSLYYLGVSLIEQNKRTDACRVFGEFGEIYGATARAELQSQVAEARTRARCRS